MAEAARVLGLLDARPLPGLARQWIVDGITEAPVETLAHLVVHDRSDPDAAVAVAALADACAIRLTVHEARALHAETVIDLFTTGRDPAAIFDTSNNYTDEVAGRARGFFGRLFRPQT